MHMKVCALPSRDAEYLNRIRHLFDQEPPSLLGHVVPAKCGFWFFDVSFLCPRPEFNNVGFAYHADRFLEQNSLV